MKKTLQRGFNLVEMSIILAVVGLILGAALVPVQSLFFDDIYEKEEQRLNEIKAAVMGYAVRNKSSFADTITAAVGTPEARTFLIPGGPSMPEGRPYLPCPDITGDGYEDRFPADITGFQFPRGDALQTAVNLVQTVLGNIGEVVRSIGGCYASRGVLPWRTLGVPPADHWGNLYTYQVDSPFANALTGFNQNSEIDEYDWLDGIPDSGLNSGQRLRRDVLGLTLTLFGLQTQNQYRPPVVCRAPPCGPAPGLTLDLAAGKQADASFNLLFKGFVSGDIVEGVPFVIISHGKNGAGAVNYARNIADKRAATPEAAVGFICNEPIDGTGEQSVAELTSPEAYNFPSVSPRAHNGIQCRESQVMGSPDTDTSDGFTFHTTRNDDFDDIVVWATREELFDALRRGGALDAPDLPAFRPFPEPSTP